MSVGTGYHILGGGALAATEAKLAAVGNRLQPLMWLVPIAGLAIGIYNLYATSRRNS